MQKHTTPVPPNPELNSLLIHALLVAHRQLVQKGNTPSAINLQVEHALMQAGLEIHQIMLNGMPDPSNDK